MYIGIESLRASWKTIGIRLGVNYPTIEAINVDHPRSEDKLMEVIAAWLRRKCDNQIMPSWKRLCWSLETIDKAKAEEIAKEHACDCQECVG